MILSLFVACLIPMLSGIWTVTLLYSRWNTQYVPPQPWRWAVSLILSMMIGLYGLKKKSLNRSGFITGIVVGFLITMGSFTFFAALLTFFISGSRITKFRSSRKRKIEADFKEGGQRNWVQVLSNGGPATVFSILYMIEVGCLELPFSFKSYYNASWYAMALLGSLSAACGDTFASEIGSVVGSSDPFLITQWRRVPRGTNGGISVGGTVGSLIGGLIVGVAYYCSLLAFVGGPYLQEAPPQWPVILYGALAGGLGSLVDSIVGATLQFSVKPCYTAIFGTKANLVIFVMTLSQFFKATGKHKRLGVIVECDGPDIQKICGRDILDNHSVNLVSCAITGLAMPYIAAVSWTGF